MEIFCSDWPDLVDFVLIYLPKKYIHGKKNKQKKKKKNTKKTNNALICAISMVKWVFDFLSKKIIFENSLLMFIFYVSWQYCRDYKIYTRNLLKIYLPNRLMVKSGNIRFYL